MSKINLSIKKLQSIGAISLAIAFVSSLGGCSAKNSTSKISSEETSYNVTSTLESSLNEPKKRTGVLVTVGDIATEEPVPGAKLEITDRERNVLYQWISTNEPEFIDLKAGDYTINVLEAPAGRSIPCVSSDFSVLDGKVTENYFGCEELEYGSSRILGR